MVRNGTNVSSRHTTRTSSIDLFIRRKEKFLENVSETVEQDHDLLRLSNVTGDIAPSSEVLVKIERDSGGLSRELENA